MDHLRNRFNPEYFGNKAVDLIEQVSIDEAHAWYNHPCTQSLKNSLDSEISMLILNWTSGAFVDTQQPLSTVHYNSQAIGAVQAMRAVIEKIDEIKRHRVEEENV